MAAGLDAGHYHNYIQRIEAVTADDIKNAAREVLRSDHSVTGVVQPSKE